MDKDTVIKVMSPGNYLSVQDFGQSGNRFYGHIQGGVIDIFSARTANQLLDNPADACVLESFTLGPKLLFEQATKMCITGADMSWKLNDNPISNYKKYEINKGDVLSAGICKTGQIAYISIADGIRFPQTGVLKKGDLIIKASSNRKNIQEPEVRQGLLKLDTRIEIIKGPEWSLLGEENQKRILRKPFTKSALFSRMAYRIKEQLPLTKQLKTIFQSVPVFPGIIQITKDGELIVLSKDCQVTGGYPRVAYLDQQNLAKFAQVPMTEAFTFHHRYL